MNLMVDGHSNEEAAVIFEIHSISAYSIIKTELETSKKQKTQMRL